jgi:hypothetical protein
METATLESVRSRVGCRACGLLFVATVAALAAGASAQEAPPPAAAAGGPEAAQAAADAATSAPADAATTQDAEETGWEFGLSGALYVLPDESDFVQPTFKADHGRLHLETRYNYEDRDSASFFVGANFEVGDKVKLALTPMVGGLVGNTDGIVPGLEADLTVWKLEAYGEAEYVFDLNDSSSKYFYMWSELSLWPTEWLRAGVVTQRTRVYRTERDVQRGVLLGVTVKKVDATVYFFNPGADDHFTVVSLGVSF